MDLRQDLELSSTEDDAASPARPRSSGTRLPLTPGGNVAEDYRVRRPVAAHAVIAINPWSPGGRQARVAGSRRTGGGSPSAVDSTSPRTPLPETFSLKVPVFLPPHHALTRRPRQTHIFLLRSSPPSANLSLSSTADASTRETRSLPSSRNCAGCRSESCARKPDREGGVLTPENSSPWSNPSSRVSDATPNSLTCTTRRRPWTPYSVTPVTDTPSADWWSRFGAR